MPPKSLEALYEAAKSVVAAASPPAGRPQEVGYFNLLNVADLMLDYRSRPPMAFDRRVFYKIRLIRGRSRIEYADQAVEVERNALWFTSHRVSYRWVPHDLAQTGYFCVFTDEFLLPANRGITLQKVPVFQPGGSPVVAVSDVEHATLEAIFEKMARELASSYANKYDLLRAYLLELIHVGQKLQSVPVPVPAPNASIWLAASFADLLERQFPLETPQQQQHLRTAADYAG